MTSSRSWLERGALAFVLLTTSGCGDGRPATASDAGGLDSGAADTADTKEPDADPMDADTPDAGADVDGEGSGSCVSVTGGGPEPWLDLQVVGRQFEAYEGRRIRVVVTCGDDGRLGIAEAAIANGAFALTFPATLNYGCYTEIALYVDDDNDDACDVGEPLWGWVTGIVQDHLLVEALSDRAVPYGRGTQHGQGLRHLAPSAWPLHNQLLTDLAMPMPCPG